MNCRRSTRDSTTVTAPSKHDPQRTQALAVALTLRPSITMSGWKISDENFNDLAGFNDAGKQKQTFLRPLTISQPILAMFDFVFIFHVFVIKF